MKIAEALSTDLADQPRGGPRARKLADMPIQPTSAARRYRAAWLERFDGVASRAELAAVGIAEPQVSAQLAAHRWRRIGIAIVLHNGPLTRQQREAAALINCGPRSALTSFTAAARWGLRGWERDEIHVLAPGGAQPPRLPGIVLHRTRDWAAADIAESRRLHRLAPALLIAAASFHTSRPGCGLLAAGVQQRLLRADDLRVALSAAPASRLRHHRALTLAVDDIAQGAHALGEIDLRRLCRRYGLPLPNHQGIRTEAGRRRYLDAEWSLPDGRAVAVEVDGAIHLDPEIWVSDQLRQNTVVLRGTLVLRYPSIVIRDQEQLVAGQLAQALGVPSHGRRAA